MTVYAPIHPGCHATSTPAGFHCTLDRGHAGPHEAHGELPGDVLVAAWDDDGAEVRT